LQFCSNLILPLAEEQANLSHIFWSFAKISKARIGTSTNGCVRSYINFKLMAFCMLLCSGSVTSNRRDLKVLWKNIFLILLNARASLKRQFFGQQLSECVPHSLLILGVL
jgi:hypothetical protein